MASSIGLKANISGFCHFLNISAGKRQKWSMGQWPSAEDLAVIHDKLGFSYRWLVTGEGNPLDDVEETVSATQQSDDIHLLQHQLKAARTRIADLEKIVSLQEELIHAQAAKHVAPPVHTETSAVPSKADNKTQCPELARTRPDAAGNTFIEGTGQTSHQDG